MKRVSHSWTWAHGARIPKGCSASELGSEIMRLLKFYLQKLTAEQFLAEASGLSSPLRKAFEWDEKEAAHQYRLTQARHLLRSISYVINTRDGEVEGRSTTITEQAFHTGRYYYSAVMPRTILKEAELDCWAMADRVIRQLEAFQKKCPKMGKLPAIAEAIAKITSFKDRRRKPRKGRGKKRRR